MAKKILKYVLQGLTALFFVFSLLVIIIGIRAAHSNKPMSLFGYVFSVVPTESMAPEINPGDFVFSKKGNFEDLKIGDDIVYFSQENNIYIVHRIIEKNPDGSFVMKGINNSVADEEFVTKDNYIAKVVNVFSFLNLGNLVVKHRGLMFGFLVAIFFIMMVFEIGKITYTIKEEKLKDKKDMQEEEKKNFIENEKQKMREEILQEIRKENEKANQSKDCDAKL